MMIVAAFGVGMSMSLVCMFLLWYIDMSVVCSAWWLNIGNILLLISDIAMGCGLFLFFFLCFFSFLLFLCGDIVDGGGVGVDGFCALLFVR
jgi:hypothetical protein